LDVSCQPDGKPVDPSNLVRQDFQPALKAAELRRIRFHDMRHTCASLLIAQEESPKYIQRQMRHASITTTLNVYGHLIPETREEAGRKLDQTVFGAVAGEAD
jgi:integrase